MVGGAVVVAGALTCAFGVPPSSPPQAASTSDKASTAKRVARTRLSGRYMGSEGTGLADGLERGSCRALGRAQARPVPSISAHTLVPPESRSTPHDTLRRATTRSPRP